MDFYDLKRKLIGQGSNKFTTDPIIVGHYL